MITKRSMSGVYAGENRGVAVLPRSEQRLSSLGHLTPDEFAQDQDQRQERPAAVVIRLAKEGTSAPEQPTDECRSTLNGAYTADLCEAGNQLPRGLTQTNQCCLAQGIRRPYDHGAIRRLRGGSGRATGEGGLLPGRIIRASGFATLSSITTFLT
jgi:hypothetical protein